MSLMFFSCGKREENASIREVEKKQPNPAVVQPKPANLKLYAENTASMNGYIEGFTNFKEALARLVNEVEILETPRFSTHVYLINNKITKLNTPDFIYSPKDGSTQEG
ncbi:hypothetical protein SAMN05660413_02804 [Salegentibacter flavus]|uniref:Uncharacterized protein n=2 Tax=Salegentibacter flavus TaxID=287099 RepID=A0A1I5CC29_9FLAO|nr:hypothetical protein SAMN05660413_02804 [Salegentibacter flavus]